MTALLRSTWLRLLVTSVILGYLVRQVDTGAAARAILNVCLWSLAVVAVLLALDRLVMVWRWVLLLQAVRTPIGVGAAARIFLVSSFVGSFLPAGVGGDAARAWSLGRLTARTSAALASVAVDRLLGVMAIVLLGTIGAVVWTRTAESAPQDWILLLAVLVAAGTVAAFWADRVVPRVLPARWRASGLGQKLLRLADAVARYRRTPRVLVSVLGLSLSVQVLRVLQAYVLGLGLGIDVPLTYYLVFMPIGLLMLLLPLSVSGFGLPQGVIVWLLQPLGVPDELSFALSTLIVLSGIAGNLPGGWLYLRGKGVKG
ncbi:MAG: flippase-like domain-containing protein [Luteitalea sp.]|nr:flippase-like domain-containing protein [Luteitalea sp.]